MSKKGFVDIHGKEYKTVAARVADFHKSRSDTMRINTELIYHDDKRVVMKALIYDSDVVIATGYAEEIRSQSNINKTSAMENCETSCIGRALACLGMGGSDSYASADEVLRAVEQQEELQGEHKSIQDEPQDIPEDIFEVVMENINIMKSHYKEEALVWHKRVLPNFLSVSKEDMAKGVGAVIKTLDKAGLARLAELQNEKIKNNREE